MKFTIFIFLFCLSFAPLQAAEQVLIPANLQPLEVAANNGDVEAQYALGYALAMTDQVIVPVDYTKAVGWTRKAANQGHPRAQYNMGVFYYHGFGVPKDYAEAMRWWRLAAQNGEMNAQYNLGYEQVLAGYYQSPQENNRSLNWWHDQAEQGDSFAQFFLGVFYHNGNGVPKDYDEAQKWFERGAEKGDARAQNGLGAMYFNGKGPRKNYVEAYQWFNLAAAQGHPDGVENRAMIEDYMTREEVLRAQDNTHEWVMKR